MTRRIPALAVLLTSALALAACGGPKGETDLGETEGVQVTAGDLQYQVQISRVLNPAEVEDKSLLAGVPATESDLPEATEWFAVFVRAKNNTDEAHRSATEFVIEDTVGAEFHPVEVDSELAYVPALVPAKGLLPAPDSVAANSSTNGAMLLFKVTRAAIENRPLEFIITDPGDAEKHAVVELDV